MSRICTSGFGVGILAGWPPGPWDAPPGPDRCLIGDVAQDTRTADHIAWRGRVRRRSLGRGSARRQPAEGISDAGPQVPTTRTSRRRPGPRRESSPEGRTGEDWEAIECRPSSCLQTRGLARRHPSMTWPRPPDRLDRSLWLRAERLPFSANSDGKPHRPLTHFEGQPSLLNHYFRSGG